MNFFGKRKNDEVRRLSPWLMLVVGFLLGVALMFLIFFNRPVGETTSSVTYVFPTFDIDRTSTAIIAGATGTASSSTNQAAEQGAELDMTATAIVAGATGTKQAQETAKP
jgi:hypothetical protein